MDLAKDLPKLLATSSVLTGVLLAVIVLVAYVGYRSDVMGAGTKQLFLALVFAFFATGAVTVTFLAFPDLGRTLYLQIDRIG
jgi:hypothetical protein